MRTHTFRTVAIAGVLGAVAGALVAFAGYVWARDRVTGFGYYSYSPLPSSTTTISFDRSTNWWQLLWPAVACGLVVAVLAALVLTVRRRGVRPLPNGWRGLLAAGAVGVVLGGVVGGALVLRAGSGDEGQPRRYVDYFVESDDAYDSTLSITLDDQPTNVAAFLAVCGATGLAAGLVAGGVLTVARRRRT